MIKYSIFILLITLGLVACAQHKKGKVPDDMEVNNNTKTATATFGGGCFWCTEAQFQYLDGVLKVESGYAGGSIPNPTYEQVCEGNTGHAEVIQVTYDPAKITYADLLQAFWTSHDPTQLNRQGNDVGTQYRSVIFYHDEAQHKEAEFYKKKLQESGAYDKPVVTEISPLPTFYKAENYHQNYYNQNGSQPYCTFVIQPKLEKFKKVFKERLKKQ
ncbi:peptide-methionine (S)-S-oxide reductase MsrA [Chitinophaga nivalis]|uniref:Peptide methionine sulfoxide reductase MsrA n=1 Tax=Chitinophaga nivalis TaxID=2991709 RepID=A0ABT3IPP2_9BACT|nr:peptide-methionine (S)-S-oxide reductase MsrA [Chitinophaga nivalis]MCW3464373.1 peptide-methionine (S)-S-oxide reductase MsrA [Chitinophaga nivalis]MCW3485936.1 peptide-methionine (S)-S-oxide reductase MsrA [Chitinophaga nivalis]